LTDGSHNYTVSLRNDTGISQYYSFTLFVDAKKPIPTLLTVSGGHSFDPSYNKTTNISGGILYTDLSSGYITLGISTEVFAVRYDGSYNTGTQIINISGDYANISGVPYKNLVDGSYNFSIILTDRVGNTSAIKYTIVVDTVKSLQPTFSISGGTGQFSTSSNPGTIYTTISNGIVNISISGESGTKYDISGYQGIMNASGGSFPYSFTSYGTKFYTINLTDKAGNTKSCTLNITYISSSFEAPLFSLNGVSYGSVSGIYYTTISGGSFTLSAEPNMALNIT
jgi:hypothetical protein